MEKKMAPPELNTWVISLSLGQAYGFSEVFSSLFVSLCEKIGFWLGNREKKRIIRYFTFFSFALSSGGALLLLSFSLSLFPLSFPLFPTLQFDG